MRVPLRPVALGLLAVAGVVASTAPATAVPDPVSTVTCLAEAPAAATEIADPAALLDSAGAPVLSCLAP